MSLFIFTSCEHEELAEVVPSEQSSSMRIASYAVSGWSDQGTNADGGIRRYYKSSEKWYVLKVYLPEIRIKPVYRISSGSGTTNPTFTKKSVSSWRYDSKGRNADVLINASYYNLAKDLGDYGPFGSKAEVAHPFGYNSSIVSWGYDTYEPQQKRLRITNEKAYIENPWASYPFETLVQGYNPSTVDKDKYSAIGRTVVGVPYSGSNIVYFFVTGKGGGATQAQAVSALQDFGCTSFAMFDGSGSSQMAWNGSMLVSSEDPSYVPARKVPVVLRFDKR